MEAPTNEEWIAAHPQGAAVLLRVTCVKGYWKGAEHYHHILPPPEGSDRTWFDREKFLKNTTSPRGIVRIATKCLVRDGSRVDEEIKGLFTDVMEELKDIYEEDMVMTEDWVALQADFNGGIVSCLSWDLVLFW